MTSAVERHNVAPRYSDAAVFGGVVYVGGVVPLCEAQDVASQTADVLAQLEGLLAACGSDKTRLLQVQIFLSDIRDIAEMNAVWDAWVPAGHAPPRATVQARLADPRWRIEVVATAAVAA